MPRSCPPLRTERVGWHGRRVRTRLRLILERVFWFVNGGGGRFGGPVALHHTPGGCDTRRYGGIVVGVGCFGWVGGQ